MKIRIFNHKTGEDILTCSSKLDDLLTDLFNTVMVRLIFKHGEDFVRKNSGVLNNIITIDYTHDIRAIIDPEKEQS